MLQPFLEEKREQIAELCRTHHVRRLAVFGSAVRDDFDPARSDVDFIVDFEEVPIGAYTKNFMDLLEKLELAVERDIDLLTWNSVHNRYLLRVISEQQQTLYAA